MFLLLFLAFVIIPILEIALLLQLGEAIGAFNTILVVLLTAFFGSYFVKQQGLATLSQMRADLDEGKAPTTALMDGVFIMAAGLLLITPGVFTDFVGFSFLIPPIRRALGRAMIKRFAGEIQSNVQFGSMQSGGVNVTSFMMGGGMMGSGMMGSGLMGQGFAPGSEETSPEAKSELEKGQVQVEATPGRQNPEPPIQPQASNQPNEIIVQAESVRRVDDAEASTNEESS